MLMFEAPKTVVSKAKFLPSWSPHSGNFCCSHFKKVCGACAAETVVEVATRPKATGL